MTNEQAKSELMQIYGMLSEEKKQAIDVLMAQNCDQCEVGNPCLYCEYEFKAKADRNEFYNWDAPIRHKADGEYISREAVIDIIEDVCPIYGNDYRYILREKINELPSVDIPPDHDGCKDCKYQDKSEDEMPCLECMHNYMDEWQKKPHWEHDEYNKLSKGWRCSECQDVVDMPTCMGKPLYKFCPWCGAKMGGEQDG